MLWYNIISNKVMVNFEGYRKCSNCSFCHSREGVARSWMASWGPPSAQWLPFPFYSPVTLLESLGLKTGLKLGGSYNPLNGSLLNMRNVFFPICYWKIWFGVFWGLLQCIKESSHGLCGWLENEIRSLTIQTVTAVPSIHLMRDTSDPVTHSSLPTAQNHTSSYGFMESEVVS